MGRNRVIYSSEGLFVGQNNKSTQLEEHSQISRVQSLNFGFNVNRQDVNQYGELSRIDSISIEQPTVSVDVSYYLTDGFNEKKLGFYVQDYTLPKLGVLAQQAYNKNGQNLYVLTSEEGDDLNLQPSQSRYIGIGNVFPTNYSLDVSVGSVPTVTIAFEGLNALSDSLGPNNSVSNPSYDNSGLIYETTAFLPDASPVTGSGIPNALRPGDALLEIADTSGKKASATIKDKLGNDILQFIAKDVGFGGNDITITINGGNTFVPSASVSGKDITIDIDHFLDGEDQASDVIFAASNNDVLELVDIINLSSPTSDYIVDSSSDTVSTSLIGGTPNQTISDTNVNTGIHIQSFTLDLPLDRSLLEEIGRKNAYAREINFPITAQGTVSAIVGNQQATNLSEIINSSETFDLSAKFNSEGSNRVFQVDIKGANLQSESFDSSVGANKTVNLTFEVQLGSKYDLKNNIFFSGSYADLDDNLQNGFITVDGMELFTYNGNLFQV